MPSDTDAPLVGVLALQGAFEEHQACLEAAGCRTRQVRTVQDMKDLDGIVLPGGESTAMGLIGTSSVGSDGRNMWAALQEFTSRKPTWGTCAGMILLAEQCVGASAVIENGQALIGGMDILVCRNYFGSQVSSFEMATPPPPPLQSGDDNNSNKDNPPYPGVFIRAPAILSAGPTVEILGRVVATPCRQAAVVLEELEKKISNGEKVVQMKVLDALERKSSQEITYRVVVKEHSTTTLSEDEKKEVNVSDNNELRLELPGAADGSNAREVICAVRKDNLLCTAFHPELTNDYRWHEYFASMVRSSKS
ncbi:SNO glutamine amidotransferase family domain containing protein [Nitzschia inconspicua]|uniref:glutaminase n=1 Tax=Nitzschia inconspicua TaxID=303405 RepID=A0A9K3KQU9_9STRA|nr:SNO glutamine amidotransferase family domain containing protein [Nitzschia inconspicua]